MSRGYLYSIVEGTKGLKRARVSAFISIFTIFLSLILIAVFLILIFNVHRIVRQIQSGMEVEIFIDNSFTYEQVEILGQQISAINGIESIHYVSKEDAAGFFKQRLGQDVFQILEENPLPASFQIKLKPQFRSANITQKIFDELLALDGIDEILYRHDLLVLLEKYMNIFILSIIIIGSLLAFGAIVLVSNTIKLVILSRKETIEIMKLVGATRSFIRRPFVVEGIIQGFIGGAIASVFINVLFKVIKVEIPGLIFMDRRIYPVILLSGIFFGFIGSVLALRKFLKN